MKEKILELYYDHYKDTFGHLQKSVVKRDRYILLAVILVALFLFQNFNQDILSKVVNESIQYHLNLTVQVDFAYVNTLLLFGFLVIVLKYYQITIFIDRQYDYLHRLEEKLTNFEGLSISREGKSYLNSYPWMLTIAHLIYTVFFPIIICGIVILKMIGEYNIYWDMKKAFFFTNGLILLTVFLLTILYMVWIHAEDFKKK